MTEGWRIDSTNMRYVEAIQCSLAVNLPNLRGTRVDITRNMHVDSVLGECAILGYDER
jgi:hypothetical protein